MQKLKLQSINEILGKIVGKRMINVFYQPTDGIIADDNMFVINFGSNKLEYSIHTFTFLRIRTEENVLLTSADEYSTPDCEYMSDDMYYSQKGFERSMIPVGIKEAKKTLKKAKVVKAHINGCGDIDIVFDNNVILELFVDCIFERTNSRLITDYFPAYHEYYRIMDCTDKTRTVHYITGFVNGELTAMISENIN